MPKNPGELARRASSRTAGLSTANRKAILNRNITAFNNKYARYMRGQFGHTPSMQTEQLYLIRKKERNNMNKAARRIQTAVRTVQAKKPATRQMSFLNNFRRLNQNDQRKIMNLAFKI